MLKIGWFSTGNGKGSLGFIDFLLNQISNKSLNASLEFVFCNREFGEAGGSDEYINYVTENNINLITLSSNNFQKKNKYKKFSDCRELYDKEVLKLISEYEVDIIILAGYMLILSEDLCTRFKFINLHPALPDGPKGTWEQVITQLIKNDQDYSGLNVHVVTKNLDAGKSIGYCKFPIKSNIHTNAWNQFYLHSKNNYKIFRYDDLDLFTLIRNQILIREKHLLIITIKYLINNKKVLDQLFNQKFSKDFKSLDFSLQIEKLLR
tara:strand:+ start:47672 stop:48463 length:792 start_codon:yes stop_codon:yes gene_type:complete